MKKLWLVATGIFFVLALTGTTCKRNEPPKVESETKEAPADPNATTAPAAPTPEDIDEPEEPDEGPDDE